MRYAVAALILVAWLAIMAFSLKKINRFEKKYDSNEYVAAGADLALGGFAIILACLSIGAYYAVVALL